MKLSENMVDFKPKTLVDIIFVCNLHGYGYIDIFLEVEKVLWAVVWG